MEKEAPRNDCDSIVTPLAHSRCCSYSECGRARAMSHLWTPEATDGESASKQFYFIDSNKVRARRAQPVANPRPARKPPGPATIAHAHARSRAPAGVPRPGGHGNVALPLLLARDRLHHVRLRGAPRRQSSMGERSGVHAPKPDARPAPRMGLAAGCAQLPPGRHDQDPRARDSPRRRVRRPHTDASRPAPSADANQTIASAARGADLASAPQPSVAGVSGV